jgi:hypothetical protein
MNVGSPTRSGAPDAEGVGYAHNSEDTRKGKNGKSEGALLKWSFDGHSLKN